MSEHFDALETRSADEREADLMAALPGQIAHAKQNSSFFGDQYKDVDPSAISSMEALRALPVIRKPDVQAAQKERSSLRRIECGAGERNGPHLHVTRACV